MEETTDLTGPSIEEAFNQQMAMMGVSNFSWWSLAAAFVFGIAGFYIARSGWRRSDRRMLCVGIVLMIYPAFTNGPWMDWILGFALTGLGYYFYREPRDKTG